MIESHQLMVQETSKNFKRYSSHVVALLITDTRVDCEIKFEIPGCPKILYLFLRVYFVSISDISKFTK
jgi:hypothetical protein